MSKRIRRDRRTILVDSEKAARDIERYCLEKRLVDGLFTLALTTCYATNIGTKMNPEWAVVFYCTLEQWNRISDAFNLIREKRHKYSFYYRLKP